MGIFDKIFGGASDDDKQKVEIPWVKLTTVSQLDEAIEASKNKKVILFKHSTRCSISSSAMNKFTSKWSEDTDAIPYYLDLIAYREVSNMIQEKFGVMHQSPQVIVLQDGKVIYDASHMAINLDDIKAL